MAFIMSDYHEIIEALRIIREAESAKERVEKKIKSGTQQTLIRNAEATGGDSVPWGDWIDYWETVVGEDFPRVGWCARCGCRKELEGAHVWIGSNDRDYYIVPMCHECNTKDNKFFFLKVAHSMAWVDYDVCRKSDLHKAYDKQRRLKV